MRNSTLSFIITIAIIIAFWKFINSLDIMNSTNVFWVILTFVSFIAFLYIKFSVRKKDNIIIESIEKEKKEKISKKDREKIRTAPPILYEIGSFFPFLFVVLFIRSFIYEPFQIPSGSMEPTLHIGDFIAVDKNYYRIFDPIFQKTIIKRNTIERGDVVVFKSVLNKKEDWIKRVIGIPGDKIVYDPITREISIYPNCKDNKCTDSIAVYYNNFKPSSFFYYGNFQLTREETIVVENKKQTHSVLQNPYPIDPSAYINYYHQDGLLEYEWIVPENKYFVMGDNRDNSEDSRFIGFIPYENIIGKTKYIWLSINKENGSFFNGFEFERFFTRVK